MINFNDKKIRYGGAGVLVVILLVLAYAFGRYSQPASVVEKEKTTSATKTVEVESKEATEKIHQLEAQLEEIKRYTHTEETTITKPDGTITSTKVEDTQTDQTKSNTAEKTDDKTESQETVKYVDRVVTVEKEKLVEYAKPQWHVGALVGIKPSLVPLNAGNLQVGVEVEHRFIGPTFIGLGAMASPSKFDGVQVMLKIGIEF